MGIGRNGARRIELSRAAFGERFSGTYYENGHYLPDALREISRLFRDPRGHERDIDPSLVDFMMILRDLVESTGTIDLLSGYRKGSVVAKTGKTSYHAMGRAVDFRISGRTSIRMFRAARSLGYGGTGRYPERNFVHIDTGPWRQWHGGGRA